jgi:hypothetical protein
MIIGFTTKTSKLIPRLFCKRFRHCVVIFEPQDTNIKNRYLLVQIARDGIKIISIGTPELQKLESAGWVFIDVKISKRQRCRSINPPGLLSCVGFAKRALSINRRQMGCTDTLQDDNPQTSGWGIFFIHCLITLP